MTDLNNILKSQQEFFKTNKNSTANERIQKLLRLRDNILKYRVELSQGLAADFKKNASEADLTEIYPVLSEINHISSHLSKWMKDKKVKTPILLQGTESHTRFEPLGNNLIISPWNYPVLLSFTPLACAIGAGNTVILKPSEFTLATNKIIKKVISETFTTDEVAIVEGDASVSQQLLKLPFHHIFFTGSTSVGKLVMKAGSENLAKVTLELGGKSPVIVDSNVDIKEAAKKIAWGKCVNAGQTCIAPDYVFVKEELISDFVAAYENVIHKFYGNNDHKIQMSKDFCRIINDRHFDRLNGLLEQSIEAGCKKAIGGVTNSEERFIPPTLLTGVQWDSPIMQDEIFGPILPVMTYHDLNDVINLVNSRPRPLALYIFSQDQEVVDKLLNEIISGGVCVNDTILQIANHNLPFGGINHSGLGSYHGEYGFRCFSHERAVLKRKMNIGQSFFFPPYNLATRKVVDSMIKKLNRFL